MGRVKRLALPGEDPGDGGDLGREVRSGGKDDRTLGFAVRDLACAGRTKELVELISRECQKLFDGVAQIAIS